MKHLVFVLFSIWASTVVSFGLWLVTSLVLALHVIDSSISRRDGNKLSHEPGSPLATRVDSNMGLHIPKRGSPSPVGVIWPP